MTDKEMFMWLASSIEREGIEDLLSYLETTDFYTAPASTAYHANYKGGLCAHSIHVYDNMVKLCEVFEIDIPLDSIKVVSLFHDLAKIDFYEETAKNKKVYSKNGSKSDELGRFDWVSEVGYKVKDAKDRELICGEHGFNSYYILSKYIKLSDAESSAILNHHAGMDNGFVMKDLNECMNRYPTLTLLHMADMLSTYIQENELLMED